jgi:beta-glucosidase
VQVPAAPLPVRIDAMTTLQEWLGHPETAAALRQAIGTDADGNPRGILAVPRLIKIIGNFPLLTLAAFGQLGLDQAAVHDLIRRVNG